MISDTVKGIIFILIKVAVILALSYVVLFVWLFAWIFIQSNALLASVTQVVTENNYVPLVEWQKENDFDSMISGEEKRSIRTQIDAINSSTHLTTADEHQTYIPLGIKSVVIDNSTAGVTTFTAADGFLDRPDQSRVQSGDLTTIKITFSYPQLKFLFWDVGAGPDASVLEFAQHETEISTHEIKRQTIGMKYYPDILPGEDGITY